MNTVYASSDGYFQQDNAPCHKAQMISDWFLEHDNEFTLLKWPPHSPDLNPIEHLWDVLEREIHIMDVQPTNLQQLLSCQYGPKSLRNVSTIVESMPRRINAVRKAKRGPIYKWVDNSRDKTVHRHGNHNTDISTKLITSNLCHIHKRSR